MSKFKRKLKRGMPAISTASLPDIIFILLFFFMVTTTVKEVTRKVENKLPNANEIKKLEKKSLVSYIYIGAPLKSYTDKYGTEPILQLNDQIAKVEDIPAFIENERLLLPESDRALMTVSLKIDSETKMGIVSDVKQELRYALALKISYAAVKKEKK
jgi:biopolymer transport protein ExbD